MTDNSFPLVPPPELVEQWKNLPEYTDGRRKMIMVTLSRERLLGIATQAAQYGADQELDACCEWLKKNTDYHITIEFLRDARRPKPPSLKEQALAALDDAILRGDCITISDALPTLRRALEQLDD